MQNHKVVAREEWLMARKELLKAEKELTRRSDELARRRQDLPWVRMDKEYRFETDEGSASPVGFYVYVPNADVAFKQAVAAGASIIMPVADMFWGDRCGTLKDPFGYSWTIATHTRDLTPEEIQEGAKSFFANAGK